MDLRFAVFNLIFRDAVLRTLLVNYADRVESRCLPERTWTGACYVELTWTDNDAASAPAGSQLLTAQVHVSRHRSAEQVFLDAVLQRLREALPVNAANGLFTVRCRETTREVVDSGVDTVFKATTFEVAPHTPRHPDTELLDLPPWTERPGATAPFSLSDLVAPHPGSASLN
jgi:hypothetical protein